MKSYVSMKQYKKQIFHYLQVYLKRCFSLWNNPDQKIQWVQLKFFSFSVFFIYWWIFIKNKKFLVFRAFKSFSCEIFPHFYLIFCKGKKRSVLIMKFLFNFSWFLVANLFSVFKNFLENSGFSTDPHSKVQFIRKVLKISCSWLSN